MRIGHDDIKVFCAVIVDFLPVISVIIQSFFHIHILHPEIFIRQLYRFHIPLHLDVFDIRLCIGKVQNIFQMSNRVQRPFIFIQGRIIGKGVRQSLCQEFDLQIDAKFQIHRSHGSRRSAVRCGVLQFVVEIAPQLCIAAYLCRDTDTCQSCGKKSHRYRQPHTGFSDPSVPIA